MAAGANRRFFPSVMAATRTITIECLRYNPETDAAPSYVAYRVPFTDDMSVLEGLQHIKDDLDGSLRPRHAVIPTAAFAAVEPLGCFPLARR